MTVKELYPVSQSANSNTAVISVAVGLAFSLMDWFS